MVLLMQAYTGMSMQHMRRMTMQGRHIGRSHARLYSTTGKEYSVPDQPLRVAQAKEANNQRFLDIDQFYKPELVKGKKVLVTGGNRGLGLALSQELIASGAEVFITSRAPFSIEGASVIEGIDVQDNESGPKLVQALGDKSIDILINNAGYFYGPVEKIDSLNFEEELKMIDICAVGVLRITSALFNAGLLQAGSKVAIISSQGGSIQWRLTQNPTGHDYGHHMSKAAANMAGMLLSQELKASGVSVSILHPGFNRTDMTSKYQAIWEVEGAVDPSIGAKRVIHEINRMTMESTGSFINCEDGLTIPW